jgi:LuxR family maltose regulon positive regulatory protein
MGELHYEWNDLTEAWEDLTDGLKRAELGGDVRSLIAGYLLASRMKLAHGEIAAAAERLERARSLVEEAPFEEWTSRFERTQLELWLAQDRLRAAITWADQTLRDDALLGRSEPEVAQLGLAHVLIVKGDPPSRERALALLKRVLQASAAEGRVGIQLEALALEALARWQAGDRAGALTSLEQALRLAEPEGYIRLFADLGPSMARLLQEARSRTLMPDYVTTLLAACGDRTSLPGVLFGSMPDPLTEPELEILRLVSAGLTNREIADRLSISTQTVKKHTGNIYSKLSAHTRTEAVARARQLNLLG